MKMCVNQLAVLIVGKKESRLIIFIIYFFLLFAHYSVFAKEPTFPGVAIADSQYRSYWQKYAKYLIQNEAPAHIKTGGDLVKARYIMQKIGDKAAFHGLFPNIDNSTRSKAARKWGWSYRDRGSCGDMTNVLEFAFKGAGIKHYLIIEASKTGMLFGTRSWNATDPNTNHGAPGIPYGKNKIAMFDLWEHGRETGSFKEAGKSRWNQIESHIWGKILETQGYGDFDLAMMPKAEREKKAVKSKLFFDKILYEQQKWFKQKQLLPTRAIQRKKSFNQALTLEIDLNELINKINQEINNQKIAIQVLREQAEQVKKNSKTLQKDIEKTNTKITKARDECKKLNQIKINQALKGRIKRSVDKLAKLKQKAETLTKLTCEKTARIGQLKDKKNAEKQLKKVDAEQIKAESLLQTAKKTIQEITQEKTSQLNNKLEQIKLKYKTGQEALIAIQQSIDTLETQLDESRILVSKVPSLDELNTLINKAKITKTSIMQLMEPYKKLPRAKILTDKIDKIKIPSIKSIKKERLWLKQHSDAVTK
ncbi:MAG: hypothetical protein KAQ91_06630, partial [Methylococcales bacterium]|nr:hypothetical protein [Methylococcales bacterium]